MESRLKVPCSVLSNGSGHLTYRSPSLSPASQCSSWQLKRYILFDGFLQLEPKLEERIILTSSIGKDELWSSDTMYRHLTALEMLVANTVRQRPLIS
jgi:hypothetical protein